MNHDGDNVPGVFQEVKFLSGGSGDGGECNAGKRDLQYPASSRRSTNSLDEPATNHWLATLPVVRRQAEKGSMDAPHCTGTWTHHLKLSALVYREEVLRNGKAVRVSAP
ncbi:hypothetical protein PCASD_25694 [Puccinia coronata f. sp. avenae]|uniref:Uncharacterized protein n=1 Tax=Puccinia coronata f. sp. avenae TaxID=200324 RepID=A0A2N5TKG2_9BASI|nr:hypothetical protein PCASD_25694 [Puccinia coronata f. sp. avenae]